MKYLRGFQAFAQCRVNGIPKWIFWGWLRAKWVADLKTVAWCIIMSPFLALWGIGAIIYTIGIIIGAIGEIILETKKILPRFMFLSPNLRNGQLEYAQKSRQWLEQRQASIIENCAHQFIANDEEKTCLICKQPTTQKETPAEDAGALSTVG